MKQLPYVESTVFLVPLKSGGFARGVVARSSKKGKVLFGYFFGPALKSTNMVPLDDLDPEKAIMRVIFGDLGLINGEWEIVGTIPDWKRAEWSMPDFVRRDPISKRAFLVRYSDTDPNMLLGECPTDYNSKLESDSMYGYGAVETRLSDLLEGD